MRNLKRALSLALASIMVLGLMVVGSSAAESYTDVTEKHNVEAIDVLQSVEPAVMEGVGEGKFEPETELTRGMMAVIMCRLLDYTVASYKGTSPFADVAPGTPADWAEPFVAACYTNGITAGVSATEYGVNQKVTTGQAGLMILKALGYFREPGDFGSDWLVETVRIGSQIGLFDGLKNGARDVLTRNDAAQICLNALESDMVEITSHDLAQGINGQLTTKAVYTSRLSTASKYNKINTDRDNGKEIIQLGEDLYDGDLSKEGDNNNFGAPSTTWKFKGKAIGTYADTPDYTHLQDKVMTADQALISDKDYMNFKTGDFANSLEVYINGELQAAAAVSALNTVELFAGDYIELFENSSRDIDTIVVTRYSLAKIDELDEDLSSTYTNKGATVSISLEALDGTGIGSTYYDKYEGDSDKELKGYTSDYAEGDVLVVALDDDEVVLDSYKANSVTGTISKLNTGSKAKVTLEEKDYALHTALRTSSGNKRATGGMSDATVSAYGLIDVVPGDTEYIVYYDKNEYVVGIEEGSSAKLEDVYYVVGLSKGTGLYQDSYYAQAVSLYDGSVTDFKLRLDDAGTRSALGYGTAIAASESLAEDAIDSAIGGDTGSYGSNYTDDYQGLYTFQKDGAAYTAQRFVSKGTTAANWLEKDGTHDIISNANGVPGNIGSDLASDDGKMSITGGGQIYLRDDTQYLKISKAGNNLKVRTATGGTSVGATDDNATAVKAIAVTTKNGNNYIANYVVLVAVNDFTNAGSEDIVFVSGTSSTTHRYTDAATGRIKTGYVKTLYKMDGSGEVLKDVLVDDNEGEGFYYWTLNENDVYELSGSGDIDDLFTELSATASSVAYDDQAGWLGMKPNSGTTADDAFGNGGIEVTSVYNNLVTFRSALNNSAADNTVDGSAFNGSSGTVTNLAGMKLAENVIIADDRGSAARNADVYTTEINSVSRLKAATERGNGDNEIKVTFYVDDEEVILIYVWSVKNDTVSSGSGTPSTLLAKATEVTVDEDAGTIALNYVHGGESVKSLVTKKLQEMGYTPTAYSLGSFPAADGTVTARDANGISTEFTVDTSASNELFTVEVNDDDPIYVNASGYKLNADGTLGVADENLNLNQTTYPAAANGTGYLLKKGSAAAAYKAYESSSSAAGANAQVFGGSITDNMVITTGYVKVEYVDVGDTAVSNTPTYARFGDTVTSLGATAVNATTGTTGYELTVNGAKSYVAYGTSAGTAGQYDIKLTRDAVTVTFTTSASGASVVADGTTTYVLRAAGQSATVVLKGAASTTGNATAATYGTPTGTSNKPTGATGTAAANSLPLNLTGWDCSDATGPISLDIATVTGTTFG